MGIRFRLTEATKTYGLSRSTFAQIHDQLAREMEDETGLPFDRYGFLLMLAQADEGELRPSDLADVLPITPSGVTRLVDRLERDGLVERRACSADGRGAIVAPTEHGEEVFRRAGRVHLRGRFPRRHSRPEMVIYQVFYRIRVVIEYHPSGYPQP